MKLVLAILIIFISIVAQAHEPVRIALITSLNSKEGKRFFNGKDFNNDLKIEREFIKHFDKNEFDILVIHHATLNDVWTTLHDETIQGVFFIGHAGLGATLGNEGVEAPSIIADYNLNDLKNAFQSVHSNMKFLALIGCNSQFIIDKFIKNGFYSNAPMLVIKAFNSKIEEIDGIREAIFASAKILAKNENYDELYPRGGPCSDFEMDITADLCRESAIKNRKLKASLVLTQTPIIELGVKAKLVISRNIPTDARAESIYPTLIIINNAVVGFFKKGAPGEVQTIEIDGEKYKDMNVTVVNDSGLKSSYKKSDINLGELHLDYTDESCELMAQKDNRGELLGVGKNYYKLNCQ
jgi:hypothetical protein